MPKRILNTISLAGQVATCPYHKTSLFGDSSPPKAFNAQHSTVFSSFPGAGLPTCCLALLNYNLLRILLFINSLFKMDLVRYRRQDRSRPVPTTKTFFFGDSSPPKAFNAQHSTCHIQRSAFNGFRLFAWRRSPDLLPGVT